tara:strand:+ start:789 stop:1592 length:804 start_codon:yes stop_codon:yes gene_type:complete
MESNVQEAMDNYFKLKNTYDEKLMRKKKRIFTNVSLSAKDKKLKLKQLKKTCINCNKNGGTIFNIDGRQLTAICGVAEPCNLDIAIDRGQYENIRKRKIDLFHEIQHIHSDIIMTKLDLLFNYLNEANAISSFDEHRADLDIISKNYTDESRKYMEIVHPESRINALKEYNATLFSETEILRNLHIQYNKEPMQKYIDAMVEKYITIIQPLVTKIRETSYVYSNVEKESDITDRDPTIRLIELPYTLEQLYSEESKDDVAKIIRYNN